MNFYRILSLIWAILSIIYIVFLFYGNKNIEINDILISIAFYEIFSLRAKLKENNIIND